MITEIPGLVTRHPDGFGPDATRVITKLFVPGEEIPENHSRAAEVVARVMALPEHIVTAMLTDVLARFADRHREFTAVLDRNASFVRHRLVASDSLSQERWLLLGAMFTHEYAVEAAALCNPSLIPHPSQAGLESGQVRVALSVRGIGEGHLSSIGFATGVLGPGVQARWNTREGPLTAGERLPDVWRRTWFHTALVNEGCDNEIAGVLLAALPESFGQADVDHGLAALHPRLLERPNAASTMERLRELASRSYRVGFPDDVDLTQRVLWPTNAAERGGMEDARFVRFTRPDGTIRYLATYTAFDGVTTTPHLLRSANLSRFHSFPLTGPAARNKGMALFPRLVNGKYLALCRGDGETTSLSASEDGWTWAAEVALHRPTAPWELLQVGNCGSPIETPNGWLVLTHGVGPMRTYSISAMLLDLADPVRVVASLPGPLLVPDANERNGYVPNVAYSCGGMLHDGTLWLPYGTSDKRVAIATVPLHALLSKLERTAS